MARIATSRNLASAGALLLTGALAWAGPKGGKADDGGIAWVKDYAKAVQQSKDEGKWLFIDFYTDS